MNTSDISVLDPFDPERFRVRTVELPVVHEPIDYELFKAAEDDVKKFSSTCKWTLEEITEEALRDDDLGEFYRDGDDDYCNLSEIDWEKSVYARVMQSLSQLGDEDDEVYWDVVYDKHSSISDLPEGIYRVFYQLCDSGIGKYTFCQNGKIIATMDSDREFYGARREALVAIITGTQSRLLDILSFC